MAKKNRSTKSNSQYKEDVLFFRMSVFFALCGVMIFFFIHLRDTVVLASDLFIMSKNLSYRIIASVLALASIAYFVLCRIKKKDESEKTFSSANIAAIVCYVTCGFLYWGTTYSPRYDALITLTVAFTLLYFIYNIYHRDFFAYSASNLVFLSTAWLFSRGGLKFVIASALFLALCAYMCFYTYKVSAKLKGKKDKCIFEPVFFSFVLTVLFISLSKFIGVPFITSSVTMIAIIAQYVLGGIYYTVKLIREAK